MTVPARTSIGGRQPAQSVDALGPLAGERRVDEHRLPTEHARTDDRGHHGDEPAEGR
ncbi:hypothetical protein [Micromonospora sp. NPDC005206]|uniref:hypothetical protein n=1 Tax=Micromonospora sp. NPDC005206 TaxID=3157022 RepID=UPI0033AEEA49